MTPNQAVFSRKRASGSNRHSDRFIPQTTSDGNYRALSRAGCKALNGALTPPVEAPRPQSVFVAANNRAISARFIHNFPEDVSVIEGIDLSSEVVADSTRTSSGDPDNHVAQVLGYAASNSRVLQFSSPDNDISSTNGSLSDNLCYYGSDFERKKASKTTMPVQEIREIRTLETLGLRNDYYSSPISWCKKTGRIAVALANRLFLWTETCGQMELLIPLCDVVTSVSFSNEGLLAAGTKGGFLLIYKVTSPCPLSIVANDSKISCLSWSPNSKWLFTGHDNGEVVYYRINHHRSSSWLVKKGSIKQHSQQICGISAASDINQLAIGSNDNFCSVWEFSGRSDPSLKYVLRHNAAIKAIAYCPWSPAILVTGGGRDDATVKFWHSGSGTLLKECKVIGQVTSLVWSTNEKQLIATFGFSTDRNPTLVALYSYPQFILLAHKIGKYRERALWSTVSPDGGRICVAVSNETIRFYKIWGSVKSHLDPNAHFSGILGSDLLELSENYAKVPGIWR